MQITVSATAESKLAPTRATAHVRVLALGPNASTATTLAKEVGATVSSQIKDFEQGKHVEKWSNDPLTTWTSRPWKDDGTQGDPVFNSAMTFHATFVDFEALAQWLVTLGENDLIELQSVTWELSDEEEKAANDQVSGDAVRNAYEKALAYALAAGYSSVAFEELADVGLLSGPSNPYAEASPRMARMAVMSDASGGGVEIRPENVNVSTSVHARFSARKSL